MTMMLPLLTLAVLLALAGAMPQISHQFNDQLAEAAQPAPQICTACAVCAASCHQQAGDTNNCLLTRCSFCLPSNCPGFGGSVSIQAAGDEEATSEVFCIPLGPCIPLKRVAAATQQDSAAGVEYCIPFPQTTYPQPPMPYPYCLPLKRLAAVASSQEKATTQFCIPVPPFGFPCIPVTGQVVNTQQRGGFEWMRG